MTTERCTCGETACESELCDCDATPCPVNHRAEQAEAARDALQATLKRIRVAVITAYGEDYAGGDTAVDVERLLRHLAEYEADMRRLLQSKNEALERAQAERDALKAELAEAKEAYLAVIEAAELRGTLRIRDRELAEARAAIERAQEVYHEFFGDGLKRDEFTRRLRGKLFEALYGQPRSDAVWLDEVSPTQHRAESPHHPCGREEIHEAHVWRGSRREFGGAAEVTRTYWCEGAPALDASHRPEDTREQTGS